MTCLPDLKCIKNKFKLPMLVKNIGTSLNIQALFFPDSLLKFWDHSAIRVENQMCMLQVEEALKKVLCQ